MTNRMDTEALRELKERLDNLGDISGDEALDAIKKLERELAQCRSDREEWMQAIEQANKNGQQYDELKAELAAEKALADRFAQGVLSFDDGFGSGESKAALAAYRKARGM